jgi:hypothetical protein
MLVDWFSRLLSKNASWMASTILARSNVGL